MESQEQLRAEVKDLLVTNLMLQIAPGEIGEETPLFGPGGLELDSVDALQIVVALDKRYGLKISDADAARRILATVNSIAAAVAESRS